MIAKNPFEEYKSASASLFFPRSCFLKHPLIAMSGDGKFGCANETAASFSKGDFLIYLISFNLIEELLLEMNDRNSERIEKVIFW